MVGDQDRQAGFAQVDDDLLHVVNRDRIDAAEGLVEHEQLRFCHQRPRDREPPFLAAAQGQRLVLGDPLDPELMEQLFAALPPVVF